MTSSHLNHDDMSTDISLVGTFESLNLKTFMLKIIPMIVECWLDCEPSEQMISPDPEFLNCISLVLKILQILLSEFSKNVPDREFLQQFYPQLKKHIFAYFPFQQIKGDAEVRFSS